MFTRYISSRGGLQIIASYFADFVWWQLLVKSKQTPCFEMAEDLNMDGTGLMGQLIAF